MGAGLTWRGVACRMSWGLGAGGCLGSHLEVGSDRGQCMGRAEDFMEEVSGIWGKSRSGGRGAGLGMKRDLPEMTRSEGGVGSGISKGGVTWKGMGFREG